MLVSESGIAVDDRFGRESGRMYLTGIQPLARLRSTLDAQISGPEREQAIIQRSPRKPDDE